MLIIKDISSYFFILPTTYRFFRKAVFSSYDVFCPLTTSIDPIFINKKRLN